MVLLTIAEVAEFLKIGKSTVRRLQQQRRIADAVGTICFFCCSGLFSTWSAYEDNQGSHRQGFLPEWHITPYAATFFSLVSLGLAHRSRGGRAAQRDGL
jgi:hypothetical protein